jgi:HTH-type transcriptional regulator / antitoxin HigA
MTKFNPSKFPIVPIIDEISYIKVTNLIEELDDIEFDNNEEENQKFAYLEAMTVLIEDYENKNFKLNSHKLTFGELIDNVLDQMNHSKKDLIKILGSNRLSELKNGKRQLTLKQIKVLNEKFKIPFELLITN